MSKPLIVVTGKNGQLGSELQLIAPVFETQYNFLFADRSQLDLSSNDSIDNSEKIICACCGSEMNLEKSLEHSNLYRCIGCGLSDTRINS